MPQMQQPQTQQPPKLHVRTQLDSGPAGSHRSGPPTADEIRSWVAALMSEPAQSFREDDDLITRGLDSIHVMRVASALRRRGIQVELGELLSRPTLADWSALAQGAPPRHSPEQHAHSSVESTSFPLSTMQQAYWIGRSALQQLPSDCYYYFEFDGPALEAERLEIAWRALNARHPMLRARFLAEGSQQILRSAQDKIRVSRLDSLSATQITDTLHDIRLQELNGRFEVERADVCHARLSLLPLGRSRLHLKISMLVADAMSFRLMISELCTLYRNESYALEPLSSTFEQYLRTRNASRAPTLDRAREYWLARLGDLPEPPELPAAVEPGSIVQPRVTRRDHWLSAEQKTRLLQLSREHGVTPSMALGAAFAEVIGFWSRDLRFRLNLPIFDRDEGLAGAAQLVGDFTNLLLLAVDASPCDAFIDRARRLQQQFRSDLQNSAYSGVDILRDLARSRQGAASRPAVVFTSLLGLGEIFDAHVLESFGELSWMASQTAQVALDHQIIEYRGGLKLNWDAVEQLFPADVLDNMFSGYIGLIERLLTDTAAWQQQNLLALPARQSQTRARVNATDIELAARPLHYAFFDTARKRPQSLALAWESDGCLSYAQLANRALRLARTLRNHGVKRGDFVAIHLPKGPSQVIAVLAVLAAGGTYVPLGIEQPARRRDRVLAQAGVACIIVEEHDQVALEPRDVPRITLGQAASVEPLSEIVGVSLDALAYVIFTSGSTGEPKGVMVSHRAAANTVGVLNALFDLTASDRILAVSALDFDLSVYDIFGPLSVGGAVVAVSERMRRSPADWLTLMRRWQVTLWQSAPAVLDLLLSAREATDPRLTVRAALLGGDWIHAELCDALHAAAPDCRLAALGGTTETAIHSTIFEVPARTQAGTTMPYGVPLPNVRCRVVDERGRDRPEHVVGELWIGGRSVADGYCGDPMRSANRFVSHDGTRWYRTGDLARYRPEGCLDFLGRSDHQIKLRGYRIELGEVEAALLEHPAITRAAATVFGDGHSRLGAAVLATSAACHVAALRAHVAERLPEYMVPDVITVLDALPLSANGKIDKGQLRRLLQEVARGRPTEAQSPQGPIEGRVAQVWCELLGVAALDREASFFAIGGDSLLAVRMLTRLRAAGIEGGEMSVLFAAPRFKDFCARLRCGAAATSDVAIVQDLLHRNDPFPPTDVQRAYLVGEFPEFTLGNVTPNWRWEFECARADLTKLEDAWNRLISHHEMMRAVFDSDGAQRIQSVVPRARIEVTDAPPGSEESTFAHVRDQLLDSVRDPSRWPLLVAHAVRLANGRTRLIFSFNYIAVDALSIIILFSDLARLYGEPDAPLQPLAVSFRDYVLSVASNEPRAESARAHWLSRVEDVPLPPQLPLRVDPSQIREPRFVRRAAQLDVGTWRTIQEHARAHGLTPSVVLATAYAEVLGRWSEQRALTLNFTVFDRREVHPDITHILGDFTSLVLVPHRPPAGSGWAESARALQQELWISLEHKECSAIEVMRELSRRHGRLIAMPVVFTSTLGIPGSLIRLSMPFGDYIEGLSQTPQVWLDNQVMEHAGALHVNWDAVEDLFPQGCLDDMFAAYMQLLHRLAEVDFRWSAPLPDLLPERQRAVRVAVNDTDAVPSGRLLHEAFFDNAQRTPDRVALACSDGATVTYGELAKSALRLGALLRSKGVLPGSCVPVCLPRGPQQVAALLGVLAAGAAYVPISVEQPPARRLKIIEGCGAHFAIHEPLDGEGFEPLPGPLPRPGDSLAYVIYTSGSTGTPKGVEITHAGAANTIEDIVERFHLGADDRVLALSEFDFDLAVFDVFGPLSVGAAVVLIDQAERREAHTWLDAMSKWRVSVWNSVPALLEMLLTASGGSPLPDSLRLALVSGDWIPLDLPARLAAGCAGCTFVALGGATEASIWSNACVLEHVDPEWTSIPYGLPLRNQRYRVVDSLGQDCPDWVPGELWIGGRGVALGYRGNPEATERQFREIGGIRWYRTGDRGRYWPDGTLEFLGRLEHRFKLRGHRIELGEVEAALRAHPKVAEAVAVITDLPAPALLAAITARGESPEADTLRSFVSELLPAYMVPDQIGCLDALPLGKTGKIDRQRVAEALVRTRPVSHGSPPQGPLERSLAQVWSDLLRLENVPRDRSFLSLGGDSLLATQLLERVRSRHGVKLSLRRLFSLPTLAALAEEIEQLTTVSSEMEQGVV